MKKGERGCAVRVFVKQKKRMKGDVGSGHFRITGAGSEM